MKKYLCFLITALILITNISGVFAFEYAPYIGDGIIKTTSVVFTDVDGNVVTLVDAGVAKIAVYNRYAQSVPQVAYIKGFRLKRGALASTIAHDSHNIVSVGCSNEELAAAINCRYSILPRQSSCIPL